MPKDRKQRKTREPGWLADLEAKGDRGEVSIFPAATHSSAAALRVCNDPL
jgi:hypothetical protein